FLLASLKHFMANERRDAATMKRGGGRTLIPLDWIESEDSTEFDRSDMLSADLLYDRRWAFTVLDRVFARLREESQASANAPLLERLNTLLSDELDRPSPSGDCARVWHDRERGQTSLPPTATALATGLA